MGRNRRKNLPIIKLKGEKFVSGGQVLAHDDDGRPIFIWGMLPGEEALAQLTKRKKDYAEGVATNIITLSPGRITPEEEEYLSTSPWQILDSTLEDATKRELLTEQFQREKIDVTASLGSTTSDFYNYRNKMEYCFWADDNGLSLSLRRRGTNQKIAVSGSALAQDDLNHFSAQIIKCLNNVKAEGRQLKSLIVRTSSASSVAALFVKDEDFSSAQLIEQLKQSNIKFKWGIEIYFSEPRSPASVATKLLANYSTTVLTDEISGLNFQYSPLSFFQGNIPIYQKALSSMGEFIRPELPIVDMFSGVGSIGISLAGENQQLSLIDIDSFNTNWAKINSGDKLGNTIKVITSSSEGALEYITSDINLIVDPPRAGLHKSLTEKICKQGPRQLIYLSCNPATQVRDIKLMLAAGYQLIHGPVMFNFFPRTPHIESLVVLEREGAPSFLAHK